MPRKARTTHSLTTSPSVALPQDFEGLGVFYLGRRYDPATGQPRSELVLYDSKDLVTHAVCVGMTGSGKTGLCIGLLEEAAIDGIPALIIDPKGDLTNLMLTFPGLRPADFEPWINADDARKKGLSPTAYAAEQAAKWKEGLATWGQSAARIQALRDAADCVIYTPGSTAGVPVSILRSLAAPPQPILEDAELLHERVGTTATSLLSLIGVDADPIQSREHILLSTILARFWQEGRDLDLIGLIHAIQTPPVTKVGVLDVDAFSPPKERFALAMRLNQLLAAPGFDIWLQGEPLDIGTLLYTTAGKPRLAIMSIAHLNDAERMFFVTLLLTQVLGWIRTQSGTTSLRAILYMDEIFGYFPPVANPPSKAPLLTLLKQARAFGLGVVLATQNPVDLDYKGLANTGTWFIGRLQTERDKARVLEGLEGAAVSDGKRFDRGAMEQLLAGLASRVFLMNNVHEDAPALFQTRWTLSYLRGPLTRSQIKALMDPLKRERASEATDHEDGNARETWSADADLRHQGARPVLPPDVPAQFIPIRTPQPAGSHLVYRPMVIASAQIRMTDRKTAVDQTETLTILVPISDGSVPIDWNEAVEPDLEIGDLSDQPEPDARFLPLPSLAAKGRSYERWKQEFATWVYRTRSLEVLRSPSTKVLSTPGESEKDFRVRLQQAGREERDRQADRLRQKYATKISALQDRVRRAEQAVEREVAQSRQSKLQAAISIGAGILGAFLGRKTVSTTNIGRATTAVRGAGRVLKESHDVKLAEENVAALQAQVKELEQQFEREVEQVTGAMDPLTEQFERVVVKPTKSNIAVQLMSLAWVPHWVDAKGTAVPAWQ